MRIGPRQMFNAPLARLPHRQPEAMQNSAEHTLEYCMTVRLL